MLDVPLETLHPGKGAVDELHLLGSGSGAPRCKSLTACDVQLSTGSK